MNPELHSNQSVSVIIPCYNEENSLVQCLESLLNGSFDFTNSEILIIDGNSTDNTKNIIDRYCAKYRFIHLISNPAKIKPVALNLGIKNAKYEIIVRIDAHAYYAPHYITKLLETHSEHSVENVGGIRRTFEPEGLIGLALSISISHPFATGNAAYRSSTKNHVAEVDTVYCGCFKKEIFKKIGLFNEALIRTQDRELNARITGSGGKILLNPDIECWYYPRTKILDHIQWTYEGAFWVFYARRYSETHFQSMRNYLPVLFILWNCAFLLCLLLSIDLFFLFFIPIVAYFLACSIFSFRIAKERKNFFLFIPVLLSFVVTHYTYGVGALIGLICAQVLPKKLQEIEYL